MTAWVLPTDIPGLVDVTLDDGTEYRDLTVGQLQTLAVRHGWTLKEPA